MLKLLTHPLFFLNFLLMLLWASPASAARLLAWRFEPNQNQLTFNTDSSIQPTAQLINNPTRLVIDLPGVSRGNIVRNQFVGGLIQEVRVGQFDAQTTRIVVEVASGYTIDPQQVRFQPAGASQWLVQLPTPQPLNQGTLPPVTNLSVPNSFGGNNSTNSANTSFSSSDPINAGVQQPPLMVTQSGFFLSGVTGDARIKSRRSDDRRTMEFEIEGVGFPPSLLGQSVNINRYGVGQIQFTQIRSSPSTIRITMGISSEAPDWQALYNNQAQALLLAPLGVSTAELDRQNPPPGTNNSRLAIVQRLELSPDRTQLLIYSDQPLQARGTMEANRNFRITIPNAQVANPLSQPRLDANSPIARLQVIQQDAQTVAIILQPSLGARLGQVNQVSDQLTALQIVPQNSLGSPLPPLTPPPNSPNFPALPPNRVNPPVDLPQVRGRPVVVIDPGHGGRDPGAVGIDGLQEAGLVLDIAQQVTRLLERQGVQAQLTRTEDVEIDLEPRVSQANRSNADVFVSIHANSINLSRPDVNGLETYYFSSGRELADTIHRSILQSIPDLSDRRVRRANFYVLRNTEMPSVLVEVGFVTGAEDARNLRDVTYRNQMASAIARGILQYLQQR